MNANEIGYEVDFLAVGDGEKCGDAIALRFGNLLANPPQQTVIVIDGGFKDSGADLVKHIADRYKTNHVHAVISTHPDNDHDKQPVVLHFKLDGPKKHFVSPVDDSSVQITGVRINGKPWSDFDAQERGVTLPAGKNLDVEVTLAP